MRAKLFLIIILISSFKLFSQNQEHRHNHKVNEYSGKRVEVNNSSPAVIDLLLKSGVDLRCGAIFKDDVILLELTNSEIDNLEANKLDYKVLIEDLTKFYAERAVKEIPIAQANLKREKLKSKKLKKTILSSKTSSSISNVIVDNYLQYYGEQEVDWAIPESFNIPSTFGGCLTVSGMEDELDAMRAAYPNLITDKLDASPTHQKTYGYASGTTISDRWDGQTIYYVKISDGISPTTGAGIDTNDPNEPDILYTSMIHSRELSALMGNIYFMWYLLENYSTDSAIKHLVDNNELYFVPIVNPDGLKWNEKYAPNGGGLQRKNLRGYTQDDYYATPDADDGSHGLSNTSNTNPANNSTFNLQDGVDPNRNFGYLWGLAGNAYGSDNDYESNLYRGPSAFSEPETQIMRDFVLSKNFKTAVWQHSYSNAIPHPYGGEPTNVSGREDEMARWHQDMTRYNRYISGAEVLSPANGIADDWMLGGAVDSNGSVGSGMNVLATTPENGHYNERNTTSGFWPDPNNIVPIAKRMVRINLMNAYYGGKYAKLHDLTQSDISDITSNLTFAIERVGQTDSDFTITVTPISGNITSVGASVTKSGMSVLEQESVSVQLVLDSGVIAANDKIEYKVSLSNEDGVIYEANFEKYYNPTVLFQDNPDVQGITNWNSSGTWTTVTSGAWNGTSIKDGSLIPYASSKTRTLTTSNSYNLSGSTKVLLQFYSKWDLERNYDFVELLGSPDGGSTWYNLNGKYNKPNSTSSTNDSHSTYFSNDKNSYFTFQNNNSSGLVYDGDQMDNWVMEEIVIDPSNNSELFDSNNAVFQFRFKSDGNNRTENYSTTYDGFYFDDFRIIKIQEPCVLSIPASLATSSVDNTSAIITWDAIPSATYDVRFRESGGSWDETTYTDLSTASVDLMGLTAGTDYEVQVRASCDINDSAWSTTLEFTTTLSYCDAAGNRVNDENIINVKLGGVSNSSPGQPASGYTDFTSFTGFPNLDLGTQYSIEVEKGWRSTTYNEAVAVWIDFNGDGNFDTSEKVMNSTSSRNTPVNSNFTVPSVVGTDVKIGSTRMRVILKYYNNTSSQVTNPCENTFSYGEVEDYTVNIIDSTLGIQDELLSQFVLYPNPSDIGEIRLKMPNEIQEFNVEISNILGQKLYTNTLNNYNSKIHRIGTQGFKTGVYFVSVSTSLGKSVKKLVIQ